MTGEWSDIVIKDQDGRCATNGDGGSPVAAPLADQVRVAAADVVRQVLDRLLGRTYSPRIRLLSIAHVVEATGLKKSTIYTLISQGKFPKPQKNLGKNLWRESTLIAWADRNDPNDWR